MRSNLSKAILIGLLCLSNLSPAVASAESATQVITSQVFPETGFTVADDGVSSFLSEFRSFGGVGTLGYPVSRPYQAGGFRYQVFQRAILQWRPERAHAVLANTLDWLSDLGKDDWLDSLGIPRPVADSGGTWERIVAEREGWLTEPTIARTYRNGGAAERFGLPQSRPERRGMFTVQRFQRVALQLWHDQVEGMPAPGTVVGVLSGDLAKQAGIIPSRAAVPGGQSSPPAAGADEGARASTVVDPAAEQTALSLINQSRQDHGLPPLVLDVALQATARAYAMDMATRDYFAHVDPDGRSPGDRLKTAGVKSWTLALENLGYGWAYRSSVDAVRAMHNAMMAETPPNDGHRANILDGRVRKLGIGIVLRHSDRNVYYVSHFTN